MIEKLVEALRDLRPPLTPEELQDALWLVEHFGESAPRARPSVPKGPPRAEPHPERSSALPPPKEPRPAPPPDRPQPPSPPPEMGLFLSDGVDTPSTGAIRVPAPKAIPSALPLARALRPLNVRTDSATSVSMDEERTAEQIAQTGLWQPMLVPVSERRFELALVMDESASMPVWRQTVQEFHSILRQLGAFRDVRLWRLATEGEKAPRLLAGDGSERAPHELVDPAGRRVILLVSDCLGPAWQDERIAKPLDLWGRNGPVAIIQTLPQRLWWRSGISMSPVELTSPAPGAPNSRLGIRIQRDAHSRPPGLAVPILELSPRLLRPWARMVAQGGGKVLGDALFTGDLADRRNSPAEPADLAPLDRIVRFRAAASPRAYKLAGYLAVAPLRQPVMRLVQYAMLPDSTPSDLAEVQLSGLLRLTVPREDSDPYDLVYEFQDGVRPLLMDSLHRGETMSVLRNVWNVVRDHFGSSLSFPALLEVLEQSDSALPPDHAFAQVTAEALGKMGGRYAKIAKQMATRLPLHVNDRLRGPIPPRNPHFTGRSELLRSLQADPAGGLTVLLPPSPGGAGGEGKTALALEHAYRSSDRYELICWLPADRPDIIRSELAELAAQLRIPPSGSLRELARELRRALPPDRRLPRWLFVFDGARDPQEILPLLPLEEGRPDGMPPRLSSPSWSVLVTSSDPRWEEFATALKVNVFERSESVRYLLRLVPGLSEDAADRLARDLGDLPLALEQAVAWQSSTGRDLAEYRELFARHLRSLPDPLPVENVTARVTATLSLGLEWLGEEHPRARRLFELWAFFGEEPVTTRLLLLSRNTTMPEPLSNVISDRTLLRETMQTISGFALARFDPEKESLQADPLVRRLLEASIPAPDLPHVRELVQAAVAEAARTEADEERDWEQRTLITPHMMASGLIDAPGFREAVLRHVEALIQDGEFDGARTVAAHALNRWRDVQGADNAPVLQAACLMADAQRGTGEVGSAAELSKKTYDRAETVYGLGDPTTLSAALGHSAGLRHLGEFGDARDLALRTWRQTAQRFERDDADPALLAADGVALGFRLLGDFPEAYEIDKQIFDRFEWSSDTRPRTLFRATHRLAHDLYGLGRYEEALELQRKGLHDLAPALRTDHPLVLQARMVHAETLRAAGLHREAERAASSAAEDHARRFGPEHPNTFVARTCLAGALLAAGRPHEALGLQQESWTGLRGVLGEEHPFVRVCAAGLAIIHRALGSVRNALEIDRWALDVSHTDPYYSLFPSLGFTIDLYLQGDLEAAQTRSAETLTQLTMKLGEGHPAALICAHNHRLVRGAAGLSPGSSPNPADRLDGLLGADHPIVRNARRGNPVEFFLPPPPL